MREKILKEVAKHGEMSLYKHEGSGLLFHYHWHDEYELLYFNKSTALLKLENKSFEMSAGTCAIINPGELHSVSSKKGAECGVIALVFKLLDVFENYENFFDENPLPIAIFETYQKTINPTLSIKSQIYNLLYQLQVQNKIKTAINAPSQQSNIKKVLSFMENNYSENSSIAQLAKEAGLSKYHFIRVFKSYTDQTPIKYLNQIRITKAKELFKTGNTDVTNTAMQVGFENISYFIKVFKEINGVTPLKYMKSMNEPIENENILQR